MVPIAVAPVAVAAASVVLVVAEVSEVVVVVFVEVVAGANGTGAIPSGGDLPDALAADEAWGGVTRELDTLRPRPALKLIGLNL